MTWTLAEVHSDVQPKEEDDRWLLIFEVPAEVTPSGIYSWSYPKDWANGLAGVYGYDISDPADVDELFDQTIYTGYMWETLRQEGRRLEMEHNPFEMDARSARAMVRGVISELKRDRPIRHPKATQMKATARRLMRDEDTDLFGPLRRDMVTRLDPVAVAGHRNRATQARVTAQARMWDLARRMDKDRGPL